MQKINTARRIVTSLTIGATIIVMSSLTGSAQAQGSSSEVNPTNASAYHTRLKQGPGEGIHEVAIEGAVRFSDDETEVQWIGDGGYVRIVTQEKGQVIRFEATAGESGRPVVGYKVDGQQRPFDKNAARHLTEILPVVFRELGHGQTERVQTVYDQDGATGVFQMISEIRSDYSFGLHLVAFFDLEGISDGEISDTFSLLTNHIDSDAELADLLYRTAGTYRDRPGTRRAYLDCFNGFQSDVERTRATQNLFGVGSIGSGEQPEMIMSEEC